MNYQGYDDLTQAEYYMSECFELARSALGKTSPNPIVGAIVLDKNGIPVGKGFHTKAGKEHAEVTAIKQAGEAASKGTLVLNLEPCCHIGKTPPCTDLIIKSGIKEVVFSNYDINPLVREKSKKLLLENNIKVISGVLEPEGRELNKFFFKWIKTKIPWIALKQAQTLDAKVALRNDPKKLITGESSRREVHNLRNVFDCILVGASTVQSDNPQLTVRDVEDCRNPVRVIVDPRLITDPSALVFKRSSTVILATKKGHEKNKIAEYLKSNEEIDIIELPESKSGKIDLSHLFGELGKREILSVLVESGPTLGGELILNKLIDEYILFVAPKIFGDIESIPSLSIKPTGKTGKCQEFKLFDYKAIGNDLMLVLRPMS